MNVEIGLLAAQFLFWEYLFPIFGIGSLHFTRQKILLKLSVMCGGILSVPYPAIGTLIKKKQNFPHI